MLVWMMDMAEKKIGKKCDCFHTMCDRNSDVEDMQM